MDSDLHVSLNLWAQATSQVRPRMQKDPKLLIIVEPLPPPTVTPAATSERAFLMFIYPSLQHHCILNSKQLIPAENHWKSLRRLLTFVTVFLLEEQGHVTVMKHILETPESCHWNPQIYGSNNFLCIDVERTCTPDHFDMTYLAFILFLVAFCLEAMAFHLRTAMGRLSPLGISKLPHDQESYSPNNIFCRWWLLRQQTLPCWLS